jgi:tetratricopeptide (TPR) repeat protein
LKTQIGYVHHFHHDVDRAIEQFEKVLALEPTFAFAHDALGDAYTHKGQFERAIAAYNQASAQGRSVNHIGARGYVYGRSGNRDLAKDHLEELTTRSAHGYVPALWSALIHLGLSDLDSLFDRRKPIDNVSRTREWAPSQPATNAAGQESRRPSARSIRATT